MFRKKGKAWAMNILLLILHSFFFLFDISITSGTCIFLLKWELLAVFSQLSYVLHETTVFWKKTLAVAKSNPLNSVFLIWYSTKHENEDSYGVHLYSLCWFSSEYQIFMISSLFPVTFLILISRMILGKHGIRPTALWRLS